MQATRGTAPLSFRATLFAVAASVLVADQITKVIVVERMADGTSIPIIEGVFHFTLRRNPGAGFSILSSSPWLFTIIATVISGLIIGLARRVTDRPHALALGLVLGGALGNLTDRVFRAPAPFRGSVVDFLDLRIWPVFNIADSAVVCGAILLVVAQWLVERRERHLDVP